MTNIDCMALDTNKKGLHNYFQEGQLLTGFECLKLSQAFCIVDSL